MQSKGIRELSDSQLDPGIQVAQPVAAFCAVGNPASFFADLLKAGLTLAHTHTFPDHHHYKQADITRLADEAKRAGASQLDNHCKGRRKVAGAGIWPALLCSGDRDLDRR